MSYMFKNLSVSFVFILFSLSVKSQSKFGIKLDLGASRVITNLELYLDPGIYSSKSYLTPSANLGVIYRYSGKLSLFGAELFCSQAEGREKLNYDKFSLKIFQDVRYHITMFSFAAYYGMNYKKFSVFAGPQLSYVFYNNAEIYYQENYLSYPTVTSKSTGKFSTATIAAGALGGLSYNVSPKFNLSLRYYFGLTNVASKSDLDNFDVRTRQLTMGFNYFFANSGK